MISFEGIVKISVADSDGNIISEKTINNTETLYMQNAFAQWLSGVPNWTLIPPSRIQIGTGTGTPSPTDKSLWNPLAGGLRDCDSITVSRGYWGQFNVAYSTTDPANTYTEVGLFDVNGNMWAHASINQFKDLGQSLTIQWMINMIADPNNTSATVTNIARSSFAQWITGTPNIGGTTPYPSYIQLGTGSGIVSVKDTTLWNPDPAMNKVCDSIGVFDNSSVLFATNFQGTTTGSWSEIGLFDSLGNMWAHGLLNASKSASTYFAPTFEIGIKQ